MLKKLVKYGNSNALILDKAILELLNIQEGATVKIHTDGTSIIISPAPNAPTPTITLNGLESCANVMSEHVSSIDNDSEKKKLYEQWKEGTENHDRLMDAIMPISVKYRKEFKKVQSPEFLADLDAIAQKYHGNKKSKEFMQEAKELQYKYVPEFKQIVSELQEAYDKVGYPKKLQQSEWLA